MESGGVASQLQSASKPNMASVAKPRKAGTGKAARKAATKEAAQPLKFFNVKASERFVFRRRDKRCLTLPSKTSLVPVFIHFSDFWPDVVQDTLKSCRKLIQKCPAVFLLKPSGAGQRDEVVWHGPGGVMPGRCWERHGCLLRTLDIVHYKVSAPDRKRELLPIERDLWSVLGPFLGRIKRFAEEQIEGHVRLSDLSSAEDMQAAMQAQAPWCVKLDAVHAEASPTVGDREHELYYSPKSGMFIRRITDGDRSLETVIPLVTLPCRLNSAMSTHPPLCRILDYLSSVSSRIQSPSVRLAIQDLASRHRVPSDGGSAGPAAGGVTAEDETILAVDQVVAPRGDAVAQVGIDVGASGKRPRGPKKEARPTKKQKAAPVS